MNITRRQLLIASATAATTTLLLPGAGLFAAEDQSIVQLINQARTKQKLPAIAESAKLTQVAQAHVNDLIKHAPHKANGNLHSWSNKGKWKGGAYSPGDSTTHPIMWEKGKEIAGYKGFTFECAASGVETPAKAVELWLASAAHRAVLLNTGIWADERWQWKAVGAALSGGFACAWFGPVAD